MGYKTEFNWILKLSPKNGLDEDNIIKGNEYDFIKSESRIYPVGIPIDLSNQDWYILAKIIIISISVNHDKTAGRYKVLRLYNTEEREFLKEYWKETINNMKAPNILL